LFSKNIAIGQNIQRICINYNYLNSRTYSLPSFHLWSSVTKYVPTTPSRRDQLTLIIPQFRHFFYQTSQSLLTAPTPHAANPCLCHFSHLALGAPSGTSITHDAFRFALLSLASLDIGIKMNQAVPGMTDNAMYGISDEQRAESQKRLVACNISGIIKDDPNDADLAIATVVALSIRDVGQPIAEF
jgi:hypothetical protein